MSVCPPTLCMLWRTCSRYAKALAREELAQTGGVKRVKTTKWCRAALAPRPRPAQRNSSSSCLKRSASSSCTARSLRRTVSSPSAAHRRTHTHTASSGFSFTLSLRQAHTQHQPPQRVPAPALSAAAPPLPCSRSGQKNPTAGFSPPGLTGVLELLGRHLVQRVAEARLDDVERDLLPLAVARRRLLHRRCVQCSWARGGEALGPSFGPPAGRQRQGSPGLVP